MGFFSKTLKAAMPKMMGNPITTAVAMVSVALSMVKGKKATKATKNKKKATVKKSKIVSKKQKQQMEVMERVCQSAYGTYIRGVTTVAARYIGHPAVAISASEMVKTMMEEAALPIHKYHVVTPKEKEKIDIKEDALNIMLIFIDSDLERKDKKPSVSFKNDTEWAMLNGLIRSVQYLNNKYHPEIRKASEELQQKKDNWIKESVEFARRVCIEHPEYATMTNKLLYNIPIDETKLNNKEQAELMLSGFASGFIKDSALGLNGLADAAIYPIDTMEVLTSPDIASVAWDGMTRDIKADWKKGTIQGKSEAVGRTTSVALPFLGAISKITKATGTAGKLTGTAAQEAAERAGREASQEAAEKAGREASQEAAERAGKEASQEATERAGKETSQEVTERAGKMDSNISVKKGGNSGANGSGVKISGEKPKTNVGEVKSLESGGKTVGTENKKIGKDNKIISDQMKKANITENSIRLVDENIDREILNKVQQKRQLLNSALKKAPNTGFAEVNIEGLSQTDFFAHSSVKKVEDLSDVVRDRIGYISTEAIEPEFKTLKVNKQNIVDGMDAWDRIVDTESKILEDINTQLKLIDNPTGQIKLYTDLKPCPSCMGVIEQFKKKYPNIEIEVIYTK